MRNLQSFLILVLVMAVIANAQTWHQLIVLMAFIVIGQKISRLIESGLRAGAHQFVWSAAEQTSGMFFYRIIATDNPMPRRMVLMK